VGYFEWWQLILHYYLIPSAEYEVVGCWSLKTFALFDPVAGTRISTFTQADLASRNIQYVHTSEEETHSDDFTFTVCYNSCRNSSYRNNCNSLMLDGVKFCYG